MSGETQAVSVPPENVFGHRKKLEFLREKIAAYEAGNPGHEIRLLDVGCSNGQYVTVHLGDLGVNILAIDPHGTSIEYAKAHNPYPQNIRFEVVKIEDIPADERFDIIVMADVIEHLEDPGALLKSAVERLRDGGIILASIPNGYGPFEIESAMDRWGCLLPSYWLFSLLSGMKGIITGRKKTTGQDEKSEALPYAYECGHVQFFTLRSFGKLLGNAGLGVRERSNGPWFGALCTSTWWGRSEKFCKWNARMGDSLPAWMVSTWYFVIVSGN